MRNQTLFPLEDSLQPAADRAEPQLWIKRLVVVPQLDPQALPLRDVTFRRGLNIIQTRQRDPGESTVVGHSVGKTLLTRLIRYTLGEAHFAVAGVRARIAQLLPEAHVVVVWSIAGSTWVVARPMQDAQRRRSLAVQAVDWQASLHAKSSQHPYQEFLNALSAGVLAGLPDFTLPSARRSPQWFDVLGWLARDSECGYRAPNEWRHEAADSGPRLDREDSSHVLQWMCGMLGNDEIDLQKKHQLLLDRKAAAKAEHEELDRTIKVLGPRLQSRVGAGTAGTTEPEGGELFAKSAVELARDEVQSLRRLRMDRLEDAEVRALESDLEAKREQLMQAIVDVRSTQNHISHLQGTLTQLLAARDTGPATRLYEHCTLDRCPLKAANRPAPPVDPARDHHIESCEEDLNERVAELAAKQVEHAHCEVAVADARRMLEQVHASQRQDVSGMDQKIGEWLNCVKDAQELEQAIKEIRIARDREKALKKLEEESNETQTEVRNTRTVLLSKLSRCYAQVLKQVFDAKAEGRIAVDGHGLRPEPDESLAPRGAALRIMTAVLAFDLSAVAASIYGLGHHPRFLIHDSPREGDMEEQLFQRIFRVATDLESSFPGREPSFQYIVTTTSPPPADLADEQGPYVRLTLDARSPQGHLLGMSF